MTATIAPGSGAKRAAFSKVSVMYALLLTMFSGIAISEIRAFYQQRDFRNETLVDARAWQKIDRTVVEMFQIGPVIDNVDSVKVDTQQGLAGANALLAFQLRTLDRLEKSVRAGVIALQSGFDISVTPTMRALAAVKKSGEALVVPVRLNLGAMQDGNLTITLEALGVDESNVLAIAHNEHVSKLSFELEKLRVNSIKGRADQSSRDSKSTLFLGWLGITVIPLAAVLGIVILKREKRITLAREQALEEVSNRETELRAVARQLTESNRDLQDFAHVASHDLQEPLRKIVAFGDRMRTKHGENMAPEAIDYLDRMQSSAARMQTLIQDLLAFSRVHAKSEPFRKVDLQTIAVGVASDLEIAVERTGGVLTVGALPSVEADPTQMRQLIQNLISNALKFRREDVAPRIIVTASVIKSSSPLIPTRLGGSSIDEWCRITVADNGIGFDEKYLDRIFKVFQRLHGRTEFEGSGIGLSVCRRIAERHNGDITATSVAGQGTTFIITLPVKQSKVRSLLLGPVQAEASDLVEV